MGRLFSIVFYYIFTILFLQIVVKLSGLLYDKCKSRPVYLVLSTILAAAEISYLIFVENIAVEGSIFLKAFTWIFSLVVLWFINLLLFLLLEAIYNLFIKLPLALIKKKPKTGTAILFVISLLITGGFMWTEQQKEHQNYLDSFNPEKMTGARLDAYNSVLIDQGKTPLPIKNLVVYEKTMLGSWSLDNNNTEIFEFLEKNIMKYHTKRSPKPITNIWTVSKDFKILILMNPKDRNELKLTGTFENSKRLILQGDGKRVTANKI